MRLTDTHLVGEWRAAGEPTRSYEVYEAAHEIATELPGRFVRRNLLRRKVFDMVGEQIDDEFVAENHALMMYPPFLSDRPTTPPGPSPE